MTDTTLTKATEADEATPQTEAPKPAYILNTDSSKALQQVGDRNPPELLYHYTTRGAVLGIVESRKVFASSVRHLNDAEEFKYAAALAREALLSGRKNSGEMQEMYGYLDKYL